MALFWSRLTVRTQRPPSNRCYMDTDPYNISCTFIPSRPHTPSASTLLTNIAQFFQKPSIALLFIILYARWASSWEPGSWGVAWMPWSQEFFSILTGTRRTCFCKGHEKTYIYAGFPVDGSPGLYEDWRTMLYPSHKTAASLTACHR